VEPALSGEGRKVALITGANKGIGLAIATELGRRGYIVLVGARDEMRGEAAAAELKAAGLDARFLQVDLRDRATLLRAAAAIEENFGRLDVLVNNAGVKFETHPALPSRCSIDIVRETFETNVFGTIAVIQAMLPLLVKSSAGRIVNVSSGLGSLTLATTPGTVYQEKPLLSYNTSKAALNSITIQFANELRNTPIKVNAHDPGLTLTDMTRDVVRQDAARTPDQAAVVAVWLATLPADGPTGEFYGEKGVIPW